MAPASPRAGRYVKQRTGYSAFIPASTLRSSRRLRPGRCGQCGWRRRLPKIEARA